MSKRGCFNPYVTQWLNASSQKPGKSLIFVVPPHGDRCLTVDLGPSTFIAMTTDLPTPSTMQVPRVGTPSGTTDPKATDHGSQRGLLRPTPTLHEPRHTGQFSLLSVHGPRAGA